MFELEKWYGDCVSPEGDALILYRAKLRWGVLRARYKSCLELRGGAVTEREGDLPNLPWQSADPGFEQRIYDSSEGFIDWQCLAPRAYTTSPVISGFGYRERMVMTIPPWKLPIRELRWGRYLSDTRAIVWIDWTGAAARSFVYCGGRPIVTAEVTDDRVEFDGLRVTFDRGTVLRDGAIGDTVLPAVPAVRRIAPARMLAVRETKWLSRAVCQQAGQPEESSWAIHEVVRWP